MNLLEKIIVKIKWLRTQPENVKVRYIWISAVVIVVIVALLWVGLFRKYERKSPDNGKNTELIIEEGKKLQEDIGSKIKMPELPKDFPATSPEISPTISPEASPETKTPSPNVQ